MHFKIAVILCAVYFFTSVLSTGLNGEQIKKCIELCEIPRNSKDEITTFEAKITEYFFGKNNEILEIYFEYNSNVADYINLKNIFLALAYEDNKADDSFEVLLLTSFEVEFFLNVFIGQTEQHQQEGFLTHDQLLDVFNPDKLKVTEDEKKKAVKLMNDLNNNNSGGGVFNVAEFLLIALEIKPQGSGLYKVHIKKFLDLYKCPITESGGINRSEILNIFKEFDMANETQLMEFQFKSNRPAAKELIELVLVTAERSKIVPQNKIVLNNPLSTDEVRSLISQFTILDSNNDGILSKIEADEFQTRFRDENLSVIQTYNIEYQDELNVVDYLMHYVFKNTL